MFKSKEYILGVILFVLLVSFMGCGQPQQKAQKPVEKEVDKPITEAIAIMQSTEGYDAEGIVRFTKVKTKLEKRLK